MRSFPLLLRPFPLLQLERRSQRTIGQLLHWPLAPALQPPLLLLPPPLPLLLPLLLPLPLLPLLPLVVNEARQHDRPARSCLPYRRDALLLPPSPFALLWLHLSLPIRNRWIHWECRRR